ncbi:MAG: hypothetical protein FJ308_17355, partial [Planctomycetes bacterium]|nr:hypothetical protein [Planctomycetota bacterium]
MPICKETRMCFGLSTRGAIFGWTVSAKRSLVVAIVLVSCSLGSSVRAQEANGPVSNGERVAEHTSRNIERNSRLATVRGTLKAGAFARNIDPVSFPVWVSGGIVAAKGERVIDPLFARSLVIEQGEDAIAVCVVDSLAVPAAIVLRAKEIVAQKIGIPTDRILISATHAHSAP